MTIRLCVEGNNALCRNEMSENIDELGVNGEFEEDGREIVLDTSGEVELDAEVSMSCANDRPAGLGGPKVLTGHSRRLYASVACVLRGWFLR